MAGGLFVFLGIEARDRKPTRCLNIFGTSVCEINQKEKTGLQKISNGSRYGSFKKKEKRKGIRFFFHLYSNVKKSIFFYFIFLRDYLWVRDVCELLCIDWKERETKNMSQRHLFFALPFPVQKATILPKWLSWEILFFSI